MNKLFIFLCVSVFVLAGKINVAVASNMSYAMDELLHSFNKIHPDIEVDSTLASSGKLAIQIRNGAPFSVFMSADMAYVDALNKDGLTLYAPKIYALGKLAVFSVVARDLLDIKKLCLSKKIKKIAVANPKTAPYGKASMEMFKRLKIINKIKPKFVYATNVSQTATYALKATDIGFIAASTIDSPSMKKYKKDSHFAFVDEKLYEPIAQGIVLMKTAKDNKDAKAFYDFILSKKARAIFKKYAYALP